jgi:hypothetical protein
MENKSVFSDSIALFKDKDSNEFTDFFGINLSTILGVDAFFLELLDQSLEKGNTNAVAIDCVNLIFDKIQTMSEEDKNAVLKIFSFELMGKIAKSIGEIDENDDWVEEIGSNRVYN